MEEALSDREEEGRMGKWDMDSPLVRIGLGVDNT